MPVNRERFAGLANQARRWLAIYAILNLVAYFASVLIINSAISRELDFNLAEAIFLFVLGPVAAGFLPVYGQLLACITEAHMKTVGLLVAAGCLLAGSFAMRPSLLLIAVAVANAGLAAAAAASISIVCDSATSVSTLRISRIIMPLLFMVGIVFGAVLVRSQDWRWVFRSWAVKFVFKAFICELFNWLVPRKRDRIKLKEALIDWWGALYWSLAFSLITWAACFSVTPQAGWRKAVAPLAFILGFIFAISLAILEKRSRPEVVLFPKRLLTQSTWSFLTMALLTSMGMGIYLLYFIKTFITIDDQNEYATTVRLIPFALSSSLGLLVGTALFPRFEGVHMVLLATPFAAIGILLFAYAVPHGKSTQLWISLVSTLLVGFTSAIIFHMIVASVCASSPKDKKQLMFLLATTIALGIALGPAATSTVVGHSQRRGRRKKGIRNALWIAAALTGISALVAVIYCIAFSGKPGRESDRKSPSQSTSDEETENQTPAANATEEIQPAASHAEAENNEHGEASKIDPVAVDRRPSYIVPKHGTKAHNHPTERMGRLKEWLKKPSALEMLPDNLQKEAAAAETAIDTDERPAEDTEAVPVLFRKLFQP